MKTYTVEKAHFNFPDETLIVLESEASLELRKAKEEIRLLRDAIEEEMKRNYSGCASIARLDEIYEAVEAAKFAVK